MRELARRVDALFFRKSSSADLQVDALDGLRGVAVLFVVLSHFAGQGSFVGLDLAGSGKYGVFLFFVLSAYLLTGPLLELPPPAFRDPRRWLRYGLRRVLRIFPLYLTVLLGTHWIWVRHASPYFIPMPRPALLAHLTLREGRLIYWTIPVEFQYYVCLPLVAAGGVILLRGRNLRLAAAAGAAAGAAAALAALGPPRAPDSVALLPYLPCFLLGSGAAGLVREVVRRAPGPRVRLAFDLAALACLAAVIARVPAVASALAGRELPREAFHGQVLLFGALWSGFLVFSLCGRGAVRSVLETRLLRFLGVVSYSLYLWHLPFVLFTRNGLGLEGAAGLAVGLGGATAAAALSYLAFERPFLRSRWALALVRPRPARSDPAPRAAAARP
jgi:peptidoglycan/LPS O-acetylase OafA/YrhL